CGGCRSRSTAEWLRRWCWLSASSCCCGSASSPRPAGGFAMTFFRRLLATDAPAAVILVRLIVGGVFLSEGIQKFLFPDDLGVGRFAKIGIPAPEVMAPFVGVCEIVCGVLFLLGLLTRFAAV